MGRGWIRWTAAASAVLWVLSVLPALAAHPRVNYDWASFLAWPSLRSGRLPVVPVLFMLAGHDLRAIGVMQALIGAAGWTFLLSEVVRTPSVIRRVAAAGTVLLIACSTYVVQWYAAVMSDSVSISLLALVVGLTARSLRVRGSVWPLVAAAALWALTRPTNAYVLLAGTTLLVPVVAYRCRAWLAPLVTTLLICGAATAMAGQGQLWQQPFLHSLTERVLPSPALRAWFGGHGMPLDPSLENLAGPYYPSTDDALRYSPQLAGFRTWLDRSGKAAYIEFLATHVPWTVNGTLGRHEELGPRLISYYGGGVSRPWYPAALRNVLLTHRQTELLVLTGAAAAGVGLVGGRRRLRPPLRLDTAVWGGAILLGFVTLAVDWGGDSWEVGRHSVDGTITVALAAVMLLVSLAGRASGNPTRDAAERPLRQAAGSCPPSDRVPS